MDVEDVHDIGPAHLALRDQGLSPVRRFDEVEHRVNGIGRLLVQKVHPGREPDINAAGNDPEADVRCHWSVAAPPDDGAWLDRNEVELSSFEIRTGAAPTAKRFIE